MKINKLILLTLLVGGFFVSCSQDEDDIVPTPPGEGNNNLVVENFIYRGLNEFYLYKADVPELADDFFNSQTEKNNFLDNYATPEDLFYDGLTATQDRFSFIIDNYVVLENSLSGISTTTGMSYGLVRYCESCSKVFGYVRLVLPNTSADEEGVLRGMIFNRIDGQQLTDENFGTLLALPAFTIGLAELEGNNISSTEEEITLTKQEYTKNPVIVTKTLDVNGQKVGYINYDSFTSDFDSELNAAFGEFKSQQVTDLVLDLRYNGGGSIRTATDLASMITGQFAGQTFMTEEWNADWQAFFEQNRPERLINSFNTTLSTGETINSLNLNTVYILTTLRSASASELVINGLDPYINVVQIGETTTGKFQGSIPVYDSPGFGRNNANTSHTYAMLPLVLKSVNSVGVSDYINGLDPDYEYSEDFRNLGILGDPNEPFLKLALDIIQGNRTSIPSNFKIYNPIGESGMFEIDYQKMYIDELPANLIQ